MEASNAPEKLYIDSREHWMNSWTAFTTKAKGDDIEYTCTDVFIEKAVKWLENNAINYWGTDAVDNGKMMLDFKKAMRV